MNQQKADIRLLVRFVVFAACVAAVLAGGDITTVRTQSTIERKVKTRTFNRIPLAVKEVRNLQKQENWFRDLEIEIQNISNKPIYFISLIIEFPNIPAPPPVDRENGITPSKSTTGFGLTFGERRLMDVSKIATPDDAFLKPGETYVFKIPDARVKGLEHMKREQNLPASATNQLELEFDIISFGDGSGYIAGKKRVYVKKSPK